MNWILTGTRALSVYVFLSLTTMTAYSNWSGSEWIGDGKPQPTRNEDFYNNDPAPQFRKVFSVAREVQSAQLHIVGLGFYEAHLNEIGGLA